MKGLMFVKYRAIDIKQWDTEIKHKSGVYIPARPNFPYNLKCRLVAAWGVLTGKYDALDWLDND